MLYFCKEKTVHDIKILSSLFINSEYQLLQNLGKWEKNGGFAYIFQKIASAQFFFRLQEQS